MKTRITLGDIKGKTIEAVISSRVCHSMILVFSDSYVLFWPAHKTASRYYKDSGEMPVYAFPWKSLEEHGIATVEEMELKEKQMRQEQNDWNKNKDLKEFERIKAKYEL